MTRLVAALDVGKSPDADVGEPAQFGLGQVGCEPSATNRVHGRLRVGVSLELRESAVAGASPTGWSPEARIWVG